MIISLSLLAQEKWFLRVKALLEVFKKIVYSIETTTKDVIVFNHLTIDNDAHRVLADGKEVAFNSKRI